MSDDSVSTTILFKAVQFAAVKHQTQRRKDVKASPYINHPIEVAHLLAEVGGITDLPTLVAAILHDTIEDTETTPAELEEQFGPTVRTLVEEMTDDKSLPNPRREATPRASTLLRSNTFWGSSRLYRRIAEFSFRPPGASRRASVRSLQSCSTRAACHQSLAWIDSN